MPESEIKLKSPVELEILWNLSTAEAILGRTIHNLAAGSSAPQYANVLKASEMLKETLELMAHHKPAEITDTAVQHHNATDTEHHTKDAP